MHIRFSLSLLVISMAVLACSPVSVAPAISGADQPQPQQSLPDIPTSTPFIASSYPTAEAAEISPGQVVSGIDVRVERAWLDGKQVYADVCYTLPDASDWTIWKASLQYADTIVEEHGTTLVSLQEPGADRQTGLRCDTLQFYVPPDAEPSVVKITIDSLAAYPREGEYCTIYMPKIQRAFEERGIAITLSCSEVNGVATMQIVSKPDDMSQEEAEQLVYSDEFFTISGPWEFTFDLSQ